jgi:hypothetical protein
LVVASTALHLGGLEEGITDFANTLSSVRVGFMGCMMIVLREATGSAALQERLGESQQQPLVFNLQRIENAAGR